MQCRFAWYTATSGSIFWGAVCPEAIAASLAGLRSMTVRSRLLAARFAEGQPDPRLIAQEAEVDLLLAGTIVCDGGQLRVSAELVQAPTGTLLASYICQTGAVLILRLLEILPETDFVAVGVFKRAEHAGAFVHCRTRMHALGAQFLQHVFDTIDPQAQTRVAGRSKAAFGRGRDDFQQNAVDIEPGHQVA